MNLLKSKIILFGFTFALLSCSTAKVISTEKTEISPGVSNSELYFRFIIEMNTNTETYFKSIFLNSTEIKTFSVIDALNNLQSDSEKLYPKGNYLLQFEVPKEKAFKTNYDEVKLVIEQDGKTILLTSKVKTFKTLKLR